MAKPPSEAFDFVSVIEKIPSESPDIQEINVRKDLLSITYTSGTTGKAKGVMLSHYNYLADCVTISCRGDWREDDVSLFLFPIFHVGGQGLGLFPNIFMGMTMVNVPKFDSEVVLGLIEKYKVSLMHMPPTAYTGLLSHPKSSSFDLSSLRYCSAGGAPLPPATVEEWKKRTGIRILDAYGLTETTCGVPLHETKVKNKMGAAGTAGSEIKIVDPEGKTVPIGTTGEILVRGPWVALGYWNKPEESENTFTKDGWFHTGDAGYMDEDEFVYVVDRYKDLIVTSGYNVAPAEVEKLILTHGAVQEVCVYGISDSYRGEAVKASIVLKEDFKGKIGQQEIIEFCREKSAVYKAPRFVEFVDEIPKTSSGKMLRRLLKGKE